MDKERIFSKFDEMEGYLEKLENIKPKDLEKYKRLIKDKFACERLLQISIEIVIDICNIVASGLRIGLPSDEDDLFKKLKDKEIITKEMFMILKEMKGFRNLLVHRYGEIDDEKVFEILSEKIEDFDKFKEEILRILE